MIKLSKSNLSQSEKDAVLGVLERGFLGMGAEVQLFEKALSDYFNRPAVCVVNGTAALHLALQALSIGFGDEVLVPSLTYVASFQAISATGATPVACDVDAETLCLSWADAESRITSRTKAIMTMHYAGGVGDLKEIYSFAQCHQLRVIEDAAHAFGTTHEGKLIGSFGDIACFSFDGIKNITSGEGGCVVSNDIELLQKIKDCRLLGVEKDTEQRYLGQRSWEFDVISQGWRYHMSNIMAAIGLEQLKRFPEMASRRRHLARLYDKILSGQTRIHPIKQEFQSVVPHLYVVRIEGEFKRDLLRQSLLESGIQTGVHYQPNHFLSYYRNTRDRCIPVTEAVFPQLLSLPLHPELTEQDINHVCERLKSQIN